MGCDGGTIPRRDELVRMKKKPEQVCKHVHYTYDSFLFISLSNVNVLCCFYRKIKMLNAPSSGVTVPCRSNRCKRL